MRLIDADALKKTIMNNLGLGDEENGSDGSYTEYMSGLSDCCYLIDNFPTIDISKEIWNKSNELLNKRLSYLERSQGEWIKFDDGSVACPICGTGTSIKSIPSVIFFRYCPYCGAMMKGGEEE